ncbi:L,D-transpeptidase family protein [Myceligenerans salitolerans]|uniref:L,D-transpeptidase family protein n=1 Tax=Myceligenerans salitolerans TaxID=1230528 RepID=A0ABS3I6T1_9MICO|nr:L,D-transpeptidase family protein [Myceligenerans salitolerans]MBO0608712.1 L,D-transpeptidase family protein [Myceligenerans salitolerans]
MLRTHGARHTRHGVAVLTGLLLCGTVLAGCSTESDPEAGGTAPSDTASASAPVSPGADGEQTTEASPTPSEEPSGTGEPESPDPEGSEQPTDDAEGQEGDGAGNEGDENDDGSTDDGSDENGTDEDAEAGQDEEPELPEYIAFGEDSERVADVQERLRDLGYHITSVDGAYGGETQQALWALQKAAGLYRDGVVGPDTRSALDRGVVPQPKSSSGKVIEIDIARQLVLAVENGRVVRVINAASGNGERFEARGRTYTASTPRGDFTVYNQIDGMHSSTLELGDMWRPKYFNGAIALHGSSSVPPFPASHGCVRVSNAAMNWIWDTWGAPPGTRVLVY